MSKRSEHRTAAEADDAGLTQTLRTLSERTTGSLDKARAGKDPRALLVCSDHSSEKWGGRWLGQSGFVCQKVADPNLALGIVREAQPEVIVVEAWAKAANGEPLYRAMQREAGADGAVFVLCNSSQEVSDAIDAEVCDIARKPFDWQLLARRARQVVERQRRYQELEETRESLGAALDVANRARKQLRHSEKFERVTGLPNRNAFISLVARAIHAAQRDENHLAVYVVGFNRFDLVVEALGRHQADTVIANIGQRLDACVRKAIDANPSLRGLKTAAIGNIGTGRFGVMLTCSTGRAEDLALRQEIAAAMSRPAVIAGQTIYLSTAVGAAVAPTDSVDAENLVIKAESAMRDARTRGVGFRYFCSEMDAAANRRLQVEQMLHDALERNELKLAYQPINAVADNRVVAAEALLRWPQPDGSFIGPDEFVPIAEDAGLMTRVGEFVVDEACRQLQAWREAGLEAMRVAVNVARSQLMDPDFPDAVMRCLRTYKVQPQQIDFELSERGVLSGNTDVLEQIFRLKALGVTISLDDFGTGESSIAYLKDMPVDALKIDRSYISTLPSEGRDSRMIAAIVALARNLELKAIAEGVENSSQLAILQALGCDYYQGFLYSPAVWPADFFKLAI